MAEALTLRKREEVKKEVRSSDIGNILFTLFRPDLRLGDPPTSFRRFQSLIAIPISGTILVMLPCVMIFPPGAARKHGPLKRLRPWF